MNCQSGTVEEAFGKLLLKEWQISNWERRPLKESQLRYAAGDAIVLTRLYWKGKEIMNEKRKMEKEKMELCVKEKVTVLFHELVKGGMSANEAAVEAIRRVRSGVE